MTGDRSDRRAADVVVIGAGVVGAAAAHATARRGASVVLLERASLARAAGSSRGACRIIAPAADQGRGFLDMGLRALAQWQSLEASSGTSFLDLHGALWTGARVEEFASALADAGASFERLPPTEVAERFEIEALGPALYQHDAGVIRADRARHALLRAADQLGVQAHERERVTSLAPSRDSVEVETTGRVWRCARAIITAGPWTAGLLAGAGIDLPLSVSSQSVAYFAVPPRSRSFPALMELDGDEPYALRDPTHGLKAALHRSGPEADPSGAWDVADTEGLHAITAWVRSRFPWAGETPVDVEACLYTNTPSERFIVERHGPVVVGSACNGLGFHAAPATGEALAELALES